jgi:hypothetical protein
MTTQALWVFPVPAKPNPVTDIAARNTLIANSAASGVTDLYVSVYKSSPNGAGRLMYKDTALVSFIKAAHTKGMSVHAAYGAPDWPTFGCDPAGFPIRRMQEVVAYNAAHPAAKFDGVVLDIEPPEPQSAPDFQALLAQYQCIHDTLADSGIKLSAAIRFFWNSAVEFPVGSGVTKAVYRHVIDMPMSNVVVMGYRHFAGPMDCSSDGIVCLDKQEIRYAASIGKPSQVLVGLETSDPAATGISSKETFFNQGQATMNSVVQTVVYAFDGQFGGVAVHNYQNAYLSGSGSNWPTTNN